MKNVTSLMLLILLLSFSAQAQIYKTRKGPMFSNEEMGDILMQRSKQQRTRAWIAFIGGPIITATGVVIALHQDYDVNQTAYNAGHFIGAIGSITTFSSIPLFVSSINNKHKAKLLLKNETTGFRLINNRVQLPGIAVRISL